MNLPRNDYTHLCLHADWYIFKLHPLKQQYHSDKHMGESTFSSDLNQQVSLLIQGDNNLLPFAQYGDYCHHPEHSGEKKKKSKLENMRISH